MKFESSKENRELIEKWLSEPIVLVSSSQERAEKLSEVGFKEVSNLPFPEEVEQKSYEASTSTMSGRFEDPYETRITESIAKAKVQYALEHGASEDAIVCAMDTMPMVFRYTEDPKAPTRWTADHLQKPKNETDLREKLKSTFEMVMMGYKRYLELFEKMNVEEMDVETVHAVMSRGYLPMTIRVNTGIAMKFPGEEKINTFSSAVSLIPRKLWEIAIGQSSASLDELIGEVIKEEEGEKINLLAIAGGIDYANPKVRDLLGIEEIDIEGMVDPGVYHGMPTKALNNFLENKAQSAAPLS